MTEHKYIFDEFDEYFRYPGGAIAAGGMIRLRLKLRRGAYGGADVLLNADGGEVTALHMSFTGATGSFDVFEARITLDRADLYWFSFRVHSGDAASYIDADGLREYGGSGFQLTVYDPDDAPPEWIYGGVIYHVFVDRFCKGGGTAYHRTDAVLRDDWGGCPEFRPDGEGIVRNNDFYGGNLEGIIEKLPYLEKLGVTCLYLSPIFEAASNHKYDTGDYMKIDPGFGTDETLERLCAEARSRGIAVILDGVFSHVGADSRYFNRYGSYDSVGAYQSKDSPYYDWFTFREGGDYDSWWGIELLPAVNKRNARYREFICGEDGVIAKWMRRGVSGWRLDVADELPDEFLYPLCAAIRREKRDALIIGEVWEDASNKIAYGVRRRYFLGGQLSGVMNYPLRDAIIACVKEQDVERLARTMELLYQNYPHSALHSLMNILGTHDTMRILTVLGGDSFPETKEEMSVYSLSDEQRERARRLLRLASVLQFTLPGVPCVYYGDEAGMEGGADPFNRRCYPWGYEDHELIAWYAQLADMRRELGCIKDGRYTLLRARDGVFAFTRGEGGGRVLVAVNVSASDAALECGEFNYNFLERRYNDTDGCVVKNGEAVIYAIRPE